MQNNPWIGAACEHGKTWLDLTVDALARSATRGEGRPPLIHIVGGIIALGTRRIAAEPSTTMPDRHAQS
jgi:hypothetical protein